MTVELSNTRLAELRQQVQRMEGGAVTRTLPVLEVFSGLVQLRTGDTYAVDSPSLAMALLAGPSRAGEWCAVVGAPDFGYEAAAAFGVDLDRTIAVPDPGEHWLSVTAGLVEVASVVLLKAPAEVAEQQAGRLRSRLRQKDALLIVWGGWPRAVQRLSVTGSVWEGVGRGHGRLSGRQVEVTVRTTDAPAASTRLWLPDADQQVRLADPVLHLLPDHVQKAG